MRRQPPCAQRRCRPKEWDDDGRHAGGAWEGAGTGRLDASWLAGLGSVTEGESLQLKVLEHHRTAGEEKAGWKVGMTSGENRDTLGAGIRPFGFLLRSRVFATGAEIILARINRPGIETEMCFRLGSALAGADVDADEAGAAVASVAAAFEINEDRITGPQSPPIRVAGNLRQWGIVLGEEIPLPSPDFDWTGIVSQMGPEGGPQASVAAAYRRPLHLHRGAGARASVPWAGAGGGRHRHHRRLRAQRHFGAGTHPGDVQRHRRGEHDLRVTSPAARRLAALHGPNGPNDHDTG